MLVLFLMLTGSPFQYTVGKSPPGGTHKVDFGGVGVDKGQVGMKSKKLHQFLADSNQTGK